MALAPISQRPRTGPLDAQRTIEMWLHVVETEGKRGSYRKVGDRLGCSDERVRQIVVAWQASIPEPEPVTDETAYVPPPFADELLAGIEAARRAAQQERTNAYAAEIEALCAKLGNLAQEYVNLQAEIAKYAALSDTERWLLMVNTEGRRLANAANLEVERQMRERQRMMPVVFAKRNLVIEEWIGFLGLSLSLLLAFIVVMSQRWGWMLGPVLLIGALGCMWAARSLRREVRNNPTRC